MTARLDVAGLSAGYGSSTVVHDVDLRVDAGEVVCLLGPNGAGKTTTLGAITGLVKVTSGEVRLDGVSVELGSAYRIARLGIAHVPEDRSLFGSLTVKEHLRLARRDSKGGRGRGTIGSGEPPRTDAEIVAWFPPLERLMNTTVGLLSGGEQQMVAIARALTSRPGVVLIDEMSLGLAPIVVGALLATIKDLAKETGCGVLLVEQHVALALEVADRAYVMSRGRLTFEGSAADLAADESTLLESYLGSDLGSDLERYP